MSKQVNASTQISEDKGVNKVQNKQCYECLVHYPLNALSFMAQFNSYICKQCYQNQGKALMVYKLGRPTKYPQYSLIQEGLYLGNQDSATDEQTVNKLGISAVCVCGSFLLTPFQDKFQYNVHLISDCPEQQIMDLFQQNFNWIINMKKQNRQILVHCAAGVSRSASFVIAYLMKSREISYLSAHQFVKSKRPIIRPNSGFVKQLKQYEQLLKNGKTQNQNQNQLKIDKLSMFSE